MPEPEAIAGKPARSVRGLPPLRDLEQFSMPVGQQVRVPAEPFPAIPAAISRTVTGAGFTVEASGMPTDGSVPPGGVRPSTVIAERNVRAVPTHGSTRLAAAVLFGAGVALGGLDAYLVAEPTLAVPWAAGGAVAALLLWFRYGRTFESEVVSVRLATPDPPGTAALATVVWTAGRVRSVIFAGTRTAVGVVDCPIPLMEALGRSVRQFEAEVGLTARPFRAPAPVGGTATVRR